MHMRGVSILSPFGAMAAALAFIQAAAAEQPAATAEPEQAVGNCIRVRQIVRTHVVDDRTVLLEMTGGRTLAMRLKYACPQLAFHDYFSYEATLGLLCAEIDHIVTRAGAHCQIGAFAPYQPEAPESGDGADDTPGGARFLP
ncbi:MAG: hypothetical protein D6807_04890 [Alphaproteobacteria bacterium]|nr:MAG: hypothetical protein D6807_04890 [Alphaproteobacteria bacterium]